MPSAISPPDPDRIENAVLALLWLTSFSEGHGGFACRRAWKGYDREALGRLHQKGLISDPVGKSKSIVFTDEGAARAGELFGKMFCGTPPAESPPKKRQPFAPSAIRLWEVIPESHRQQILDNVFCSHCAAAFKFIQQGFPRSYFRLQPLHRIRYRCPG